MWHVSNLGSILYGSFGSLPNCLRKDSWVEWELMWMLMDTWSIDSKTQVSKCEWEEWIVRADDAQELPCLTYWITFPTHIFKFEFLLKRLRVYLHQTKEFQTPHCNEKLRFACWTTMKLEETYVILIRTALLRTLIWSLETLLQMKHLGTNQVCNLQFHFPHDRISCSLGIDWYNYQPLQSFIASLASLFYWPCQSICCSQ